MSCNEVCSTIGDYADAAWDGIKEGASAVGSFLGRVWEVISNFCSNTVMPFLANVWEVAKNFFNEAKSWAEANPTTVRAALITAAVSIVATAVSVRCFCSGASSEVKPKAEKTTVVEPTKTTSA